VDRHKCARVSTTHFNMTDFLIVLVKRTIAISFCGEMSSSGKLEGDEREQTDFQAACANLGPPRRHSWSARPQDALRLPHMTTWAEAFSVGSLSLATNLAPAWEIIPYGRVVGL
jgi:hypothetical protein